MSLACNKEDLQELLNSVTFTRKLGFSVFDIAQGRCTLSVPFQEEFERPGGVIAGQIFMAAADVAMWLAIKTQLGLSDSSVTSELKTAFLRPAKKQDFRCTATVLKIGRQLVYGVAECLDASNKLLTHHTVTYVRVGE